MAAESPLCESHSLQEEASSSSSAPTVEVTPKPSDEPVEQVLAQPEQPEQQVEETKEQQEEQQQEEAKDVVEEPAAGLVEQEESKPVARKTYTKDELQALNKNCNNKPEGLDLTDVWLRDLERTAMSPDADDMSIALKPQWGRAASLAPGRSLGLSFGRVGSPNGPTAPIHSKLIDLGPGPEHAEPPPRQSLDGPAVRANRFGDRDKGTWRQPADQAKPELDDRGKPVDVQKSPFAAASRAEPVPNRDRDNKRWERGTELNKTETWRAGSGAPPRTKWDDAMHPRRRHDEGMGSSPGDDMWPDDGAGRAPPTKHLSINKRGQMSMAEMEKEHQEFRERAKREAAARKGAPHTGDTALIEMDMDELMDDEQRAQKYGAKADANGAGKQGLEDHQAPAAAAPQGIKISFQQLAAQAKPAQPPAGQQEQPGTQPAAQPMRIEELEARLNASTLGPATQPTASARGPPPGMGALAGLFQAAQQQQAQPPQQAAAPAPPPSGGLAPGGDPHAGQALLGLLKKASVGNGAGAADTIKPAPPGFPPVVAPAAPPVPVLAASLDLAAAPQQAANAELDAKTGKAGAAPPMRASLFGGAPGLFGNMPGFGPIGGSSGGGDPAALEKIKQLWGEPTAEPAKPDGKPPGLPTATAAPAAAAANAAFGGLFPAAAGTATAATPAQQLLAGMQQQQQQQPVQQPQGQQQKALQSLLQQLGQQQQQQQQQQSPALQGWNQPQQAGQQVNAVDAAAAAAAQRNRLAATGQPAGAQQAGAGNQNAQEFFQQFLAGARNAAQQGQQPTQQGSGGGSTPPAGIQQPPDLAHFQQWMQQAGGTARPPSGQVQAQAPPPNPPPTATRFPYGQPAYGVAGNPAAAQPQAQPQPQQQPTSDMQQLMQRLGKSIAAHQQQQQQQQQGVLGGGLQPGMHGMNHLAALQQQQFQQHQQQLQQQQLQQQQLQRQQLQQHQESLRSSMDNQGAGNMQNLLALMRQQQQQHQHQHQQQAANLYGLGAQPNQMGAAAGAGVPKLPGQVLPGGGGLQTQQHMAAAMQQANPDMQRLLASLAGGGMQGMQGPVGGPQGRPATGVSELERFLMAQAHR